MRAPQISLVLLALVSAFFLDARAEAPTFQGLMDPAVFPAPQGGMTVERAEVSGGALEVVTTGAEFRMDASGEGVFRQRVGTPRAVARIRVTGLSDPPTLTHSGPGFAFCSYASPKLDLRVNGDSLFMFHARESVTVEITRSIEVGFTASHKGSLLVLDEYGGFGLFCSDDALAGALEPYEPVVARHTLPADAVLWVGVCPPKPFDWDRSLKNHVVWHWSMDTGYPADADLAAWAAEGNIVLLQSEVMLWKDWNLAFEPRHGPEEFARVRETIHRNGMRFIVYTSPYYFLKRTPLEHLAMNSFENFSVTGFPPGWPHGDNMDLFLPEIEKVMREHRPDGLYFDGQYAESAPALYALARKSREIVGEDGILEWHSTGAFGPGMCFVPQADAYVDFILRGEGRDSAYGNPDYLRYFVSCHNTSNSIGVLCNNGPRPTADLADRVLAVNARMHTIASWLSDPATMKVVREDYQARLTPALRGEVERGCAERQARIAETTRLRLDEQRALKAPPGWGTPVLEAAGETMAAWTPSISAQNAAPFAVEEGALRVTARANTHAFFTAPLGGAVRGFGARLRQGTDGGQSWGPAVCVRWKNGSVLRVGLRSDGLLQADLNGDQRLFGKHDAAAWTEVRARWLARSGVVEARGDGGEWQVVWKFEHGGTLSGPAESVSAGKVPYNGGTTDHSEPGPEGVCLIRQLAVW